MPNSIFRNAAIAVFSLAMVATPALAGDIVVQDAYARSSGANAKSGAIFMEIMNMGDSDDQLIAVSTPIARKAELHTHIEGDNGVMQMRQVEGGFTIPAGGMHMLVRGGDHVMLMGLTAGMSDGASVELTLSFEKAGDVVVTVPVDLKRKPMKHKHD